VASSFFINNEWGILPRYNSFGEWKVPSWLVLCFFIIFFVLTMPLFLIVDSFYLKCLLITPCIMLFHVWIKARKIAKNYGEIRINKLKKDVIKIELYGNNKNMKFDDFLAIVTKGERVGRGYRWSAFLCDNNNFIELDSQSNDDFLLKRVSPIAEWLNIKVIDIPKEVSEKYWFLELESKLNPYAMAKSFEREQI
jgi:hypothetical protein